MVSHGRIPFGSLSSIHRGENDLDRMELGWVAHWRQLECRGSGDRAACRAEARRANRQPETWGGSSGVSKSARARLDLAAGKGESAIGTIARIDVVDITPPDAQQPSPPDWLQQPECGWAHCPLLRSETRC